MPIPSVVYAPFFRFLQRLGVHVTPNHFHFPIPDTSQLAESVWTRRSELRGVTIEAGTQLALLDRLLREFGAEMHAIPRTAAPGSDAFHLDNGSFETVDAEIYYGLIRDRKPRRILEIGAGHSTRLASAALARNRAEGHSGNLVVCDPRPPQWAREGSFEIGRVLATQVQTLPLDEFTALEAQDILFIDSSHVLAIGSDVNYLILDVLPSLASGVLVHLHDIFLPAEYPRHWVRDRLRFWNEQYVLQAFLAFNHAFQVIWASHFMALHHPERLAKAFPAFRPGVAPGSFWIERRGEPSARSELTRSARE